MNKILFSLTVLTFFLVGCKSDEHVNLEKNGQIMDTEIIHNEEINQINTEIESEKEEDKGTKKFNQYTVYVQYYRSAFSTEDKYNKYISDFVNNFEIDSISESRFDIDELQILRNIPFAKKGHDFKNADLADFFAEMYWYKKIDGKNVTWSDLSNDEQKFVTDIDMCITEFKEYQSTIPKYEYDSNKSIVYSFWDSEEFKFPYININSEKISEFNEEIYDWALPIIMGTYFECAFAEYEYYLNGDILTIIAREKCGYGGETGFLKNIDINTGEFISNSEFLEKNGIEVYKDSNIKDKLLNSKITTTSYDEFESFETLNDYLLEAIYFNIDSYIDPESWSLVYLDNNQNVHIVLYVPAFSGATGGQGFLDCIVNF